MEKRVTRHGEKRLKERMGIPKKSCERQYQMAMERGLPHGKMTGSLYKWVTAQAFKQPVKGHYYIYSNNLFIVKQEALVTVIPLPANLLKAAATQIKRHLGQ